MTNPHTNLLSVLGFDPRIEIGDGTIPTGVHVPYLHVHTSYIPTLRPLTGDAKRGKQTWLVVCVNNTPSGARTIANQIIDRVDNLRFLDTSYHVETVSLPVEDREHPAGARWSVTVEITYLGKRET